MAVPGEGLVALAGAKARLRSLRRHEAAGLVEYRLFGEVPYVYAHRLFGEVPYVYAHRLFGEVASRQWAVGSGQ